jgi:hypothetical protein
MYLIINFGAFTPMEVIGELEITPKVGYLKKIFVKYKNIQII